MGPNRPNATHNQKVLVVLSLLSYMYSAPGYLVDVSDFMCGICIGIHLPLMHIE